MDVARFRPPRGLDPHDPAAVRASFVGNSMLIKTRRRLECAAPRPELAGRLEDLARDFGESPERSVPAFLAARHPELLGPYGTWRPPNAPWPSTPPWSGSHPAVPSDCLARVMPFFPTIVGDSGWLEIFPDEGRSWRRLPEMAYYNQLPGFYPRCQVNLNVTSRQMKGAVNQRVFDVPACGAFLLTDRQEQMDALFEPGLETASYAHPDELPDMVRHYLDIPRSAAHRPGRQRRILADHSYDRRMETLFAVMRRLFAG